MSYRKEYYQNNKEKCKAWRNKWRNKNLEKSRAQARKYRCIHKEEINRKKREQTKKFREKYPLVRKSWIVIRRKVLERDKYICQLCGRKAKEVHHKDATGSNRPAKEQNNNLDNLITLCHKCHMNEDFKLWNTGFNKGKWKEEIKRNAEILSLVGKKSLADIGKMFGISRQRVHQLVNK